MLARTSILFMISHIILGTTLLVDGKQIVCKNRAMGARVITRGIRCWKPMSFTGKMCKGKTKREDGNQFQQKLNRVNMQLSRREKTTKNKRIFNQGQISRNRWMDGKQKRKNVGKKGGQKNRKIKNRNKYGRRWLKKKKRRNMIPIIFHFHTRDHSDKKSSFLIHILINIESFSVVKLWNALKEAFTDEGPILRCLDVEAIHFHYIVWGFLLLFGWC